MFGHRYLAAAWYGPRYFGPVPDGGGEPEPDVHSLMVFMRRKSRR